METFYIEPTRFWELFNTKEDSIESKIVSRPPNRQPKYGKRMRTCESSNPSELIGGVRYIIMWANHKPGKKKIVWEGDGYLTLVGQMAHLSDLRGRMLEDPTILDDLDCKTVKECGELLIGNTEVQIQNVDKSYTNQNLVLT